jgi:uncharacterized membrane-anchored protein YitT (DUF2179 family)
MRAFWKSTLASRPRLTIEAGRDFLLITMGALLQAVGLRLFLVPAQLASGGVSGLSQIANAYTGWPIGLMVFAGNLPLFLLGWRFLGGPRFALRTAYAVAAFSLLTDLLVVYIPAQGLTDDLLLNSLYGGVISGIGYGLVYRGRGTSGGSDILARILNDRWNVSISQSYLWVDSLVILAAGVTFGWEKALYALVLLYISGLAAEQATQGSDVVRTALIVSSQPQAVAQGIMDELERGVTLVEGSGGFTGAPRTVLYCVLSRSEVPRLKALVREADPAAFMVVGSAHEALGEGFRPLHGQG